MSHTKNFKKNTILQGRLTKIIKKFIIFIISEIIDYLLSCRSEFSSRIAYALLRILLQFLSEEDVRKIFLRSVYKLISKIC